MVPAEVGSDLGRRPSPKMLCHLLPLSAPPAPLLQERAKTMESCAIPLCPEAAEATPHQCQVPQQRSVRPPPQTHQTPRGHCPCLGPATGSQKNLKWWNKRGEDSTEVRLASSHLAQVTGQPSGHGHLISFQVFQRPTVIPKPPKHHWTATQALHFCPGPPVSGCTQL